MLNTWYPDPDALDWVPEVPAHRRSGCIGRNSEQTVKLSWQLLKLAKRNIKERVCASNYSPFAAQISFFLRPARPCLCQVGLQSPKSTQTCLGTSLPPFTPKHDNCPLFVYCCRVKTQRTWYKPTLLNSQQNVPTPLHWRKNRDGREEVVTCHFLPKLCQYYNEGNLLS